MSSCFYRLEGRLGSLEWEPLWHLLHWGIVHDLGIELHFTSAGSGDIPVFKNPD